MPVLLSVLSKVLFVVVVNIPFVHAQSPVATQSTSSNSSDSPDLPDSTDLTGVNPEPTPVPSAEPTTLAQPDVKMDFETHFNLGTKSYQEKNFEAAIEHFGASLKLQPESTATLTDLGLSYYQLQQKGLAIAYFRRALFIDPSLPTASAALKFALSELEIKEIPHQIETYERLRSSVLNSVSLGGLHLLTALLMFSVGFIWLRFWGRRRRSLEAEEALPPLPLVGIFLTLGFLVSLSLTALKIYDLSMPRATIIAEKVSAQIAPGDGQNALFELYAGFEVLISNTSQGWTQVRYPGGLTGWVKNDSLMPTSGQNAF